MALEMIFNGRVLAALTPPTERSRTEFRDARERGLYLYLTSAGVRTFYLYQKFEGRPLRIKLGRFPDLSVSAARDKAREIKGQLAQGMNPKKPSKPTKSVSFGKVSEEYLDAKRSKHSASTQRTYRIVLDAAMSPWLKLPMASISKEQIVRMHEKISADRGKGMADLSMRIFRAMFEFYIDRYDYTGSNPAKTLSRNKIWNNAQRRQSLIANADLPVWFDHVMRLECPTQRDYLLTLLFTGARKMEIATLRWDNVEFADRSLTIPITKNGSAVTLPLSSFVEQLLRSRKKTTQSPFVFPSSKDRSRSFNPNYVAGKVSNACGVPFMLHDLRRTFATIADSLTITQYTIKRLLNHKSGADVTAGYIISDFDQLREPTERIAARILEIVKPPNH